MKTSKPDIKVIIADDHDLFRDGLKITLQRQPHIKLLDEASNGAELVRIVEEHLPDIILTDIKMPLLDGIEATKLITQKFPSIGIIALSMFDEEDLIVDMLEAGAKGYLVKNCNKEEIVDAIQTVYNGHPYYCRLTNEKLRSLIARSKFNPYIKKNKIEFNSRELEIINLICKELTNKEIGEKLFLSQRTVEGIRMKIQEKMNVQSTVGLVLYAIKNKLIDL